jgi:hypothetical protein
MNDQQLLGLAIILFTIDLTALLAWTHLMKRDAEGTQRKLPRRHDPAQRSVLRKQLPSSSRGQETGTHKPHLRCSLKHSPREKRGHRRHEGS